MRAPKLKQDPMLVNAPLRWSDARPAAELEQRDANEVSELDARPPEYAFKELFIFGPHPLLTTYRVKGKDVDEETGCYVVDFRKMFTVASKAVQRNANLRKIKILELDIATRHALRLKLADWFGRVPVEDEETVEALGLG